MTVSIGEHPEFTALTGVAIAWVMLLIAHAGWIPVAAGGIAVDSMHPISVVEGAWRTAVIALPAWALMSAAMMVPGALPAARHVAVNSLRWRRHRAVATFVASFVAPWIVFGFLAIFIVSAWDRSLGPRMPSAELPLLVAVAIAAVWQLTPTRRRQLRGCHRSVPLPPRGWRAVKGNVHFGLIFGLRCIGSCWALMLVMATATRGHLLWTLVLTAVVVGERSYAVVRHTPQLVAGALAGMAVLMVATGDEAAARSPTSWFCQVPVARDQP